METNDQIVNIVNTIFHEASAGMLAIKRHYGINDTSALSKNPHQDSFDISVAKLAAKQYKSVAQGNSIDGALPLSEMVPWLQYEAAQKVGFEACRLYEGYQNERVNNLLQGKMILATAVQTSFHNYGSPFMRHNGLGSEYRRDHPTEIMAPFYKALVSQHAIVLRQPGTDDFLTNHEKGFKELHPNAFQYIDWTTSVVESNDEGTVTQRTELTIV